METMGSPRVVSAVLSDVGLMIYFSNGEKLLLKDEVLYSMRYLGNEHPQATGYEAEE